MLKKNLGTIIALILLTMVGSFMTIWIKSSRSVDIAGRNDNTLRRWISQDPAYLNGPLRSSVSAAWILGYINHSLIDWDMAKDDFKPMLAKSWDIDENGLDYTFHLRDDVTWHDGEAFDAEDVLYSFSILMDPILPVGQSRSSLIENAIRSTLPTDNNDERVDKEEYLKITTSQLPILESMPVMDGNVESGVIDLASGPSGSLRAALFGNLLYITGPVLPNLDTVIFFANEPGELTRYGPSTKVAKWDGYFILDCNNGFPSASGWQGLLDEEGVKSATYATGENGVECLVDLGNLLGQDNQLPDEFSLILCNVDDVQLRAADKYTLKFHFPRKNYQNLEACGYMWLVPEHYYNDGSNYVEHPMRDIPLGVGPYKFVKWERNQVIALERWEDYWGDKPKIQRVEFKIINDPVVAYQAFKKGDLDAITVDTWTYTKKAVGPEFDKHFQKIAYTRPGYTYLNWNNRRSFFADERCRKALSHLVDVKYAADNILFGLYQPITGSMYFKEPCYVHELEPYEYNPEKAAALLDEAGWLVSAEGIRVKDINEDGIISDAIDDRNMREKFIFEILVGGGADSMNDWRALSITQNCKKVGIICKMRPAEYAVKMKWLREGTFDANIGGWSLGVETDPFRFFHSSQIKDGFNYLGYSDPEMDALMEKAREELDKDKRTEMFRQVHRMQWEKQPATFLVNFIYKWVLTKRLKNVKTYSTGFDYLEWELEGHENGV
jgi:peptide/nickel transport system substrate-binding protein